MLSSTIRDWPSSTSRWRSAAILVAIRPHRLGSVARSPRRRSACGGALPRAGHSHDEHDFAVSRWRPESACRPQLSGGGRPAWKESRVQTLALFVVEVDTVRPNDGPHRLDLRRDRESTPGGRRPCRATLTRSPLASRHNFPRPLSAPARDAVVALVARHPSGRYAIS